MTISTSERISNAQVRPLYYGLAFSALVSTILLVLVGSIVRVSGHGLGCPDWPLCYGQAIPPFLAGAWVEFSHRLVGAITGLQIILLAVLAWRNYRCQAWIFGPALAAVGFLLAQIMLGGLHVMYELPQATGLLHTGLAMLIVGLLAGQLAVMGPLTRVLSHRADKIFRGTPFSTWVGLTAVATYALLLTGSYVTRSGASLVCPSFPLCGAEAEALRPLINIQMLHRFAAFSVALLTAVTLVWLWRRVNQKDRGLSLAAYSLGGLLLLQFGLGIGNVLLRLPMWTRILHLTVGTVFWAGMVMLWMIVAIPNIKHTGDG